MDEQLRIRIYSIKAKYKVTLKTIAAVAGVNYTLLSQCLSGKKHFPQKHLGKLIEVLDRIEQQNSDREEIE